MLLTDWPTVVAGIALLGAIAALLLLNLVLNALRGPGDEWESLPARLYGMVHIGKDGSIAENVGHGTAFAAAVLFLAAGTAAKSRTCLAMAAAMAITWFDDSAQYHERMGTVFSEAFPNLRFAGLDAHTFGELFGWLTIGGVFLLLALWASRQYRGGDRLVVRLIAGPMLLLIACASIVDLAHALLAGTPLNLLLSYLEDGGEMVAIALLAIAALYLARHPDRIGNAR